MGGVEVRWQSLLLCVFYVPDSAVGILIHNSIIVCHNFASLLDDIVELVPVTKLKLNELSNLGGPQLCVRGN